MHTHFETDILDETRNNKNSSEVNSEQVVEQVPVPESPADIDALVGGSAAVDVPESESLASEGGMIAAVTRKSTHVTLTSESATGLHNNDESEHFRKLWDEIQSRFVDDPRVAIQQADALTTEVIEKITEMFASELNSLQNQWQENNEVTTEDLRQALQHYRVYFNSLVG